MSNDKIVELIDQFAAEKEYRKQMEILHQLRKLLAEEREQRQKKKPKASD